jgi:L-ascorbate 6-phosphate lactonase
MGFKAYLDGIEVKPETICVIWLGQAGFLLKTAGGRIIVIDPYLTDYVYKLFKDEHGYGFKRMTAPAFQPGEIEIDYLFSSHEHGDHLDVDAVTVLLDNKKTALFTNKESMKIASDAGVPLEKIRLIRKDMTIDFDEFKLIVTKADHGELCRDAMGFIFDFGFARVYYSGDTSYNRAVLDTAIGMQPEIALLPINGAFGNLNAEEAARLADDLKARVCIPHHFWTFPLHKGEKGDPMDAIEAFPKLAPDCRLVMLYPGEAFIYGK